MAASRPPNAIAAPHRRHRPTKYNKIESTTLTTTEVASGKYTVVFFPRYKKSPGSRPKSPPRQHQQNPHHHNHRTEPNQNLAQLIHKRLSTHFARYTIFPATIVHNTFVSRISSGETVKTSRSNKAKSARFPAAMVPMESRFMARAEFRV
jgi:hypothetical protein